MGTPSGLPANLNQTSREAVEFAEALMLSIGQSVVHVHKEIEGFVLNRLQAALLWEAWARQRDGEASCVRRPA